MCGICGIFDPNHRLSRTQIETDVSRMTDSFRYRGPDGEGTAFDPSNDVGLGHRRLSIIDLSGGKQPMSTSEGQLSVVFNGEIYNFLSERKELESRGYAFKTKSDTEVILALYEFYGQEAWQRLRGQFAIGLWDARKKQLTLVRDRIGEKPLFYARHQDVLYFSSELKALLTCANIPHDLDETVLGMYLLSTHVPAPGTFIKGVEKLPAGYSLIVTAQGSELKPYWKPKTWPDTGAINLANVVDDFRDLFQEAVKLCTVSDVPIGTYLSGGLDSTSVTWAVTKVLANRFHSFAIFNRENHENHPDWKYAQEAAAHLKTNHHNVFYTLPELMGLIPEFIEKSDEPFDGPTNLVSYLLAKNAREHVKVVLTGNGADELLGGYQFYYRQTFRKQQMWQRLDGLIPRALRSGLAPVLEKVNPKLSRLALPHEARRIAANIDYNRKWFDLLCPELDSITRKRLQETMAVHHSPEQRSYIKRYLLEDLFVYHQHSITTMPDATGMACSLEARNPFLDYKLVEYIFSLPPDYLIRPGTNNKFILIKAVESHIPSSILTRNKEGFSGMTGDQITRWIRTDGRSVFRDTLYESELAKKGYFPKGALPKLWERYEQATTIPESIYYQIPLWSIVMLELWYRRHVLQTN